ncbi:MAG: carbamoyltransferase HypF [Magnetococcales bacterium]|nr:carbamoyltransferase HypF [Magnetococcales bacterium]MBF0322128.1 carbamoyltransferase HypF [Magnetococcales bacterium]
MPDEKPLLLARHLTLTGQVQGVGFRPFVFRLAREWALSGWVRNTGSRVEIRVQGRPEALEGFIRDLLTRHPPLARPGLEKVAEALPQDAPGFVILPSQEKGDTWPCIPPDQSLCSACREEMADPQARRYHYPFTNCTQCGPRYTIMDRLPYDRNNTAMAGFPLCEPCRAEFDNPLDRRFHAQPLACPDCGPRLTYHATGCIVQGSDPALDACLAAFARGEIVAVKGVGGYHLMGDAGRRETIARLREKKPRPDKPLAVMVPEAGCDGLDLVRSVVTLELAHAAMLTDPARPIVLLPRCADSLLPLEVAPGLNEVGVMLPYSPLHHLLTQKFGRPLLATSANLRGDPVLTRAEEVEERLAQVADGFLHHDRPIRRPADDSVFRVIAGQARLIRGGRGLAPQEYSLPFALEEPILATGSQMKNTIALAWEKRVVMSPHIGDLQSPRALDMFQQVIGDLQTLYGVTPRGLVVDLHPEYQAVQWAERQRLPVYQVQHHVAHASSLLGEVENQTEPTLVFTWDGLGLGFDGSFWGGEALLGTPGNWQRVATMRTFSLPGGDRVTREIWRSAAGLCWECGLSWRPPQPEWGLVRQAWERRINTLPTHAVGRLFDAAAALILGRMVATYEGQAAMELEAVAGHTRTEAMALPYRFLPQRLLELDWEPLLHSLYRSRESPDVQAARFHASLAFAILHTACTVREQTGVSRVGLTGGVFQNRLLTESAIALLAENRFSTLLHTQFPGNDGGIAFGQIVEAAARHRATIRHSRQPSKVGVS